MKTILRDGISYWIGYDVILTENGFKCDNVSGSQFTSRDSIIIDIKSFPLDWHGGWYSYDGTWSLTPIGLDGQEEYSAASQNVNLTVEETITISKLVLLKLRDLGTIVDEEIPEEILSKITTELIVIPDIVEK